MLPAQRRYGLFRRSGAHTTPADLFAVLLSLGKGVAEVTNLFITPPPNQGNRDACERSSLLLQGLTVGPCAQDERACELMLEGDFWVSHDSVPLGIDSAVGVLCPLITAGVHGRWFIAPEIALYSRAALIHNLYDKDETSLPASS
jgi:hypothetical protein